MGISIEEFLTQLSGSRLVTPEQLEALRAGLTGDELRADAGRLADQMVRDGRLTAYQAESLLAGNPDGLVLGNYVLRKLIGEGGMGQVFEAIHRRMDRVVAIKVLSPKLCCDTQAIRRFQREVRAAARLKHTNIVTAYDADAADGIHFLVMEYVRGRSLSHVVKDEGPFTVGKAVDCVLQAARGLDYAHRQGVIHRDIKPGNLLLDRDGTIKILDMGLARLGVNELENDLDKTSPGELTDTVTIMGSVDYMAPEQALNSRQADQRADVYSLGCTLAFLLLGRPPYGGQTMMEKLIAHREQPIPSLRALNGDVPVELDAVFAKMIAKRPEQRHQRMAELIPELQKLGSGIGAPLGGGRAAREFVSRLSTVESSAATSPTATAASASTSAIPQGASRPADSVAGTGAQGSSAVDGASPIEPPADESTPDTIVYSRDSAPSSHVHVREASPVADAARAAGGWPQSSAFPWVYAVGGVLLLGVLAAIVTLAIVFLAAP